MGDGVRRPSLVTFALVPILLGLVGGLATSTVQVSGQERPWVWAVTALLVVASVVIEVHRNRHGGEDPLSVRGTGLDEVAGQLALAVGAQWRREEERRRAHDPFPLPVRWGNAPETLMDHEANALDLPAGAAAEPLDLTGRLDQIAEIYQRIPARRLVILGGSGSGKTILAVRLVLDLLEVRATTDRVPVIFSLASWDPATASLRDWLAGQLIRDYPGLAGTGPGGSSLAAELVAAERVLPVLDGFDEIAEGLRRAALEALNGTTLPMVLTSRPDQYAAAVRATRVLSRAAGIALAGLTLTDLINYLPRTARRVPDEGANATVTVWDRVLNELREAPQPHLLAEVLATPLMVGLARVIYSDTSDRDPWELLDTDRFRTAADLEDHLLGTFLPTVYRQQPADRPAGDHPRWDAGRAQRWLGHLAHHLDQLGTRDLAWWQLGNSLRRSTRMPVVGVVTALVFGFVWCLVFGIGLVFGLGDRGWLGEHLVHGLVPGLVHLLEHGLVIALVAGLAFGLLHGLMARFEGAVFEPSRVRIRIGGGTATVRGGFVPRLISGLGAGLVGTVGSQLSVFLFGPAYRLSEENLAVLGLVLVLVLAFALGLTVWLAAPIDIRSAVSPADLLHTNRTTAVFVLLTFGLGVSIVIGFEAGFMFGLTNGLAAGLAYGLANGLTGGFEIALSGVLSLTAWGQWVVFSRLWLPLTGRLPWAVLAFLDDACERGVLRQAGAFYQFRHARLQDHLNHAPGSLPDCDVSYAGLTR